MERLAAGAEHTRAISTERYADKGEGLYLYREGNGQRNELHGEK